MLLAELVSQRRSRSVMRMAIKQLLPFLGGQDEQLPYFFHPLFFLGLLLSSDQGTAHGGDLTENRTYLLLPRARWPPHIPELTT
jgi:hypothetical protein